MRDSFIFYRSFYDAISELDQADKTALFEAICAYALDNTAPTLKGPAKAVFMLIRPQLDANTRKYENGCKGGRPPKEKPKQNQTKTKPKRNDNDNENENENDNENDNENGNVSALSIFTFGSFQNVKLTKQERQDLADRYERSEALIDKVSKWLKDAKNPVPDHFALCEKFAVNESWPKKKVIEPSRPLVVTDPLQPDEQERKVAEMRARLNGAIESI